MAAPKATWWEEKGSLPFACTECGKCCQVNGDVFLSPDDTSRMSEHLNVTSTEFAERYAQREVEGWVQLRDRSEEEKQNGEKGCIFLGADGKTCGVYEARPVQCRTYPFFPRMLRTPEAWNAEVVATDAAVTAAGGGGGVRGWSPDTGGCEGMLEVKDVRFNKKKDKWTVKRPAGGGASGAGEGERGEQEKESVSAEEIGQRLRDFEEAYATFPHAGLLDASSTVRRTAGDKRGKREADALWDEMREGGGGGGADAPVSFPAGKELGGELFLDQILAAASMVDRELLAMSEAGDVLPLQEEEGAGGKAEQIMQEWAQKHVVRLGLCPWAEAAMPTAKVVIDEEVVDDEGALQAFLRHADDLRGWDEEKVSTTLLVLPNFAGDDFETWHAFTEELEDALDEGGALEEIGDEVLVACFHPDFEYAGLEGEDRVLHYEKRSPLPVINLLRTSMIDKGIERGATAEVIAEHNEKALRAEGHSSIRKEWAKLLGGAPQ